MKSPREILLGHHRAMAPKLDVMRMALMSKVNAAGAQAPGLADGSPSLWLHCVKTLWRELIFPSRRIWTGLAAIWLLIFIINLSQRGPVSGVTGQPLQPGGGMMSWQTQQRWMDELLVDRSSPPKSDPRYGAPKPRTQTHEVGRQIVG